MYLFAIYCSSGEIPLTSRNAKVFCPGLTEAVLNQIDEEEEGSIESLNINEAAPLVEKSLMTFFLHEYGWTQVKNGLSLNPFKTWRNLRRGMRMMYDSEADRLLHSKMCRKWLAPIFSC